MSGIFSSWLVCNMMYSQGVLLLFHWGKNATRPCQRLHWWCAGPGRVLDLYQSTKFQKGLKTHLYLTLLWKFSKKAWWISSQRRIGIILICRGISYTRLWSGCSVSKQLLKEGLEGFSLGDPFYTICTLCFQNFFELLDGEVNKNF